MPRPLFKTPHTKNPINTIEIETGDITSNPGIDYYPRVVIHRGASWVRDAETGKQSYERGDVRTYYAVRPRSMVRAFLVAMRLTQHIPALDTTESDNVRKIRQSARRLQEYEETHPRPEFN